MVVIVLLACLASCFVPVAYVAVLIPLLNVLQNMVHDDVPSIFSVGPVDAYPVDLLTILVFLRFFIDLLRRRKPVIHKNLYLALGVFLMANLAATFFAKIKFGDEHMLKCLVTWVRFVSEVMLLPIVASCIRSEKMAERCIQILVVVMGAMSWIQFVNLFGAPFGVTIGEVQGMESGRPRYFGPVGDSVGFVLLLGYLQCLYSRRLIGAAVFIGGILLTAGLGATVALIFGTGLFFAFLTRLTPSGKKFIAQELIFPLGLLVLTFALVYWGGAFVETISMRLGKENFGDGSGKQRLDTFTIGFRMFLDNPVLGVGFAGFGHVAHLYGAEEFFDYTDVVGATANANNQALEAVCSAGLPGLISLGLLLLVAVRMFYETTKARSAYISSYYKAAFVWLLSMIFGNLVSAWILPGFLTELLWLSLGIAVAVGHLERTRANTSVVRPAAPKLSGRFTQ